MRPVGLHSLFVRLPSDLRGWVADEATDGHRSMNSVVIEALKLLMVTRVEERRGWKPAAAVSRAIVSVELAQDGPDQGGEIMAILPTGKTFRLSAIIFKGEAEHVKHCSDNADSEA